MNRPPTDRSVRAAIAALKDCPEGRETIQQVMRVCACDSRLMVLAVASAEEGVLQCNLPALLDRAQPTVSHHIRVLRQAGLITTSPCEGTRHTLVMVNPKRLLEVRALLVGC